MLHDDLLALAKQPIEDESGNARLTEAALRRTVSTAYYALFHLLVDEATSLFMPEPKLRPPLARIFQHTQMLEVSKAFATAANQGQAVGKLKEYGSALISEELGQVAEAFISLHENRSHADYKLDRRFSLSEVADLVKLTERAFQAWQKIRETDQAREYLASLAFWKQWRTD